MSLNESIVEDAALPWFGDLGYSCLAAEALTTLHDTLLPKLLSAELSVDGGNYSAISNSSNRREMKS